MSTSSRTPAVPSRLAAVAAAVLSLGLAGCATTATTAPAVGAGAGADSATTNTASAPAVGVPTAGGAPVAKPGAAPAARPDPSAPKPFADIIKEAKRTDGFIPVWRQDDKVWLELSPERMNKLMHFSVNVDSAVGERGLYAAAMGPSWLVQFRQVGKQVQLVAAQTDFRGERDPASARAVRQAFSDSLLGSSAVASAPHPDSKAVLVDASFLLGDLAGYSTALEFAYRLPFAPDRANSYFESVRTDAGLTTLNGQVHYATARIPAPPLLPPGATPPPRPAPPQTTPDPRSLFIGFVYNFRDLPATPMAVRPADPRVGFFTESYTDLSDDLKPNPRVHPVKRWRLEKKDPTAALSEPVEPIVYWMENNIPKRYRASVEAGILEWNKAFEKIGFKGAVVAKQQPDDANFSLGDSRHASIRWFLGADVGFAQGPSHADPRTGEILDADIRMADVFGRGSRRSFAEDSYGSTTPEDQTRPDWKAGRNSLWRQGQPDSCDYADQAATEMAFALDLLEARGDIDPESPEAEAFVQAYVKDVIVHEVGHTLGMRHNFKSSTTVTREQLKGMNVTVSNSVMDYNPFNLPLEGEAPREANMKGLGAYDYWAIEYAYKPLDPATQVAELEKIAARSATDPLLAFADDGDARTAVDPLVNTFDLGDDPLAWFQRRLALSQELWARVQARGPQPGDDALRLRRSLLSGFRQLRDAPESAAKYVGGMYSSRDRQGGSGRAAFTPVEPAKQREALGFLTQALFSPDSFKFKPEFLTSLQPDYIEWNRGGPVSVQQAVLGLQKRTLDRLLDPGTAQRLIELPNYLPEGERKSALSLNELYTTVQGAVWEELKSGKDIDPLRRSLQREHLKRLQGVLTRPGGLPADAVSLARLQATRLQGDLKSALGKGRLSVENRAHLQESLGLVSEALRATMQRS
jgi:hypothetical protein